MCAGHPSKQTHDDHERESQRLSCHDTQPYAAALPTCWSGAEVEDEKWRHAVLDDGLSVTMRGVSTKIARDCGMIHDIQNQIHNDNEIH